MYFVCPYIVMNFLNNLNDYILRTYLPGFKTIADSACGREGTVDVWDLWP